MAKIDNSLYIQQVKNKTPIEEGKAPIIQTSPSVAGAMKLQMMANSDRAYADAYKKGVRLSYEAKSLQNKVGYLQDKAGFIEQQSNLNFANFMLKGVSLAEDIYLQYEEREAQELLNQYKEDLTETTANELMNINIKPSDTLETILEKVQKPYKELEAQYKDILFNTYTPHTANKIWKQMQQIGSQVSNSRVLESARSVKNQREALGILGISSKITKEYISGLEDLIEKGASEDVIDAYTASFNKQIQQKVADGVIPINIANKLRDTLGYHRQYYKNFGDVLAHTSNVLTLSSGIKALSKLPPKERQQKLIKLIGSKMFKSLPIKERRKFLKRIRNTLRKTKSELFTNATKTLASHMAYAIAHGDLDSIPDKAWKLVAHSKKTSTSLSKMLTTAMGVYMSRNPDMSIEDLNNYYSKIKSKIIKYYGKSPKADMFKTLLYLEKNYSSAVRNKVNKAKDILKRMQNDGIIDSNELNTISKYKKWFPKEFRDNIDKTEKLVNFINTSINNLENLPDYEMEQLTKLLNDRGVQKLVGNKVLNKFTSTIQEAIITNRPERLIPLLNKLNKSYNLNYILNKSVKRVNDTNLIPLIEYANRIKKTNPTAYRTIKTAIGVRRYNKIRSISTIMKNKNVSYIDAQDYYDKVRVRQDDVVNFVKKHKVSFDEAEDVIRQAKLIGKTPEDIYNQHNKKLTKDIYINTDKIPPIIVDKIDDIISENKDKIPENAKKAHIVNSNKGSIVIFTNELGLPIKDKKNIKNPIYFKVDLEHSDPDVTTKALDTVNKTKKGAKELYKGFEKLVKKIINRKEPPNFKNKKEEIFNIPKLPKDKDVNNNALKINKEINNE